MPSKSNDQGFAMTGSFSCMMLSAMLIFDNLDEDKEKLYIAPVNISRDLVFLKTGDSIKVKSVEGRDEINILSLE